jgi:hypothetical protein
MQQGRVGGKSRESPSGGGGQIILSCPRPFLTPGRLPGSIEKLWPHAPALAWNVPDLSDDRLFRGAQPPLDARARPFHEIRLLFDANRGA